MENNNDYYLDDSQTSGKEMSSIRKKKRYRKFLKRKYKILKWYQRDFH